MAIFSFYLQQKGFDFAYHDKNETHHSFIPLEENQTHAGYLHAAIQNFLFEKEKPQVIITASGPGSFTNCRIQLATLLGLSLDNTVQAHAFDILQVLHSMYPKTIATVLNNRGGYYYLFNGICNDSESEFDLEKILGKSAQFSGDAMQKSSPNQENYALLLLQYYLRNLSSYSIQTESLKVTYGHDISYKKTTK